MKSILCLAGTLLALAAGAQTPRVALLLSTDKRHGDEFDLALKALGWTADRYVSEADSMKELARKLGGYVFLLGTPLFNVATSKCCPAKSAAPSCCFWSRAAGLP